MILNTIKKIHSRNIYSEILTFWKFTKVHKPPASKYHSLSITFLKVRFLFCTPRRHIGEMGYIYPLIPNFSSKWCDGFTLQPLTAGKGRPHWIGIWVQPRASMDALEKINTSCSCRKSNCDISIIKPVRLVTSMIQLFHTGRIQSPNLLPASRGS